MKLSHLKKKSTDIFRIGCFELSEVVQSKSREIGMFCLLSALRASHRYGSWQMHFLNNLNNHQTKPRNHHPALLRKLLFLHFCSLLSLSKNYQTGLRSNLLNVTGRGLQKFQSNGRYTKIEKAAALSSIHYHISCWISDSYHINPRHHRKDINLKLSKFYLVVKANKNRDQRNWRIEWAKPKVRSLVVKANH